MSRSLTAAWHVPDESPLLRLPEKFLRGRFYSRTTRSFRCPRPRRSFRVRDFSALCISLNFIDPYFRARMSSKRQIGSDLRENKWHTCEKCATLIVDNWLRRRGSRCRKGARDLSVKTNSRQHEFSPRNIIRSFRRTNLPLEIHSSARDTWYRDTTRCHIIGTCNTLLIQILETLAKRVTPSSGIKYFSFFLSSINH